LFRERVYGDIAFVRQTADGLIFLGLIGTVVGFIIALSEAGDLAEGLRVALYPLLVGLVTSLWLRVNYHILRGGGRRLIALVVMAGEEG
jgi:biopolymer transport protein ExbB/TolQ